jgi:hypothetical protein
MRTAHSRIPLGLDAGGHDSMELKILWSESSVRFRPRPRQISTGGRLEVQGVDASRESVYPFSESIYSDDFPIENGIRRFEKVGDVVTMAAFLPSDAESYITGAIIKVDGGLAMQRLAKPTVVVFGSL